MPGSVANGTSCIIDVYCEDLTKHLDGPHGGI